MLLSVHHNRAAPSCAVNNHCSLHNLAEMQQACRAVVIDVRMQRAYVQGTAPGAVNHPLYQPIAGWTLPANMRRAGFAFFGMYGTERNPAWLRDLQLEVPKGTLAVLHGCQHTSARYGVALVCVNNTLFPVAVGCRHMRHATAEVSGAPTHNQLILVQMLRSLWHAAWAAALIARRAQSAALHRNR